MIDGNTLVCTPGGADATIVALDKHTGDVIWKCAVPGGDAAAYSSIVVSDAGGVKQYVQFVAKGVVGVDAKTGKFLWRYEKTANGSPANIPTPLAETNFVYSATGKGGGGLVKIHPDDGELKAEQEYYSMKLPTAIGGVVKVGDYLYGTTSQALMCVKFSSGEVAWTDRSIGAASICYADGRLYLHGENGDVALVERIAREIQRRGPLHSARRTRPRPCQSLGLSGGRQWPSLYSRLEYALVLRRQSGEVAEAKATAG